MDCITFNNDINAFIDGELEDEELNDFLNHLRSCKSCSEELEVNYIVHEGMNRLDSKNADFNLISSHRKYLEHNAGYIKRRKKLMIVSNVFRTVSFWVLIATAFVFIHTTFFLH
ncbi:MAG: zf-HC2 domain-containing protein [Eubacteriales bacterium]|nr:zf-HC2 domain-containing protein [Eubacteriales bacterium]